MKEILMSIHPEWCEKIFYGEKTIELRKTRPNIPPPFDVLVYCTKHSLTKTECMNSYLHKNEPKACKKYGEITTWCSIGDVQVNSNTPWSFRSYGMHGKVIGSFVCDQIFEIPCETTQPHWLKESTRLTDEQYMEYLGNKNGYGWHITEPKLFDKPRWLGEFRMDNGWIVGSFPLTRPPQSWCYVKGGDRE